MRLSSSSASALTATTRKRMQSRVSRSHGVTRRWSMERSIGGFTAGLIWGLIILISAMFAPDGCMSESQAQGDEREERRAMLHLADTVARVCAHEASLSNLADCYLVWQAARRHGETAQERTAWLFRHSPCALRGVECGRGRHMHDPGHWSSTLPLTGDEQPEGWPSDISWETFAPRWAAIRRTVRRLIRGDVPPGGWPCREDPDTWGGRVRDAEHVRRHAAHLRALDCRNRTTGEPTRNEGYRWR